MNEKKITPPKLGELWAEQGGIYCGVRLIDGVEHHIITTAGIDNDLTAKNFDEAKAAQFGEINGHTDWHTGDQEDYMLAYVNAREQFKCDSRGVDGVYWTRSFHHGWPWAVDFETGSIYETFCVRTFRVRPFRKIVGEAAELDTKLSGGFDAQGNPFFVQPKEI